MTLDCEIISARDITGKNGAKYQTITLLDRSPTPLEHMVQMSIPEARVTHQNSDLQGKRVTVSAHKIEQFYGEIRLQGTFELKASGTPKS